VGIVRRYAERMPQLQAQEALRMSAAVALGSGTMKKGAAQSLRAEWMKAAREGRERVSAKDPQKLAAMGIRLQKVKPKNG